jgi:hypothetical protein
VEERLLMALRTVWTYPWDVARLGVDEVLSDLRSHDIDGIDLAATYHPISTLSPRGDSIGGFFSPRGAVYFPARAERYGLLRPEVWPDADLVRVWPDVAQRIDTFGLELNAWTVCLFQPWIAQRYPETARVLAGGARLDSGVCVSNHEFHEYAAALVGDMIDQFPISLIKLEGVYPPMFDYGWTRRRIFFELTSEQKALMALCFCESCRARANEIGLDVNGVRQRTQAALRVGSSATDPLSDEEVRAYSAVAPAAAKELIHALSSAVRNSNSMTQLSVASPFEGGGMGLPLEAVAGEVGSVQLINSFADLDALRAVIEDSRSMSPRPSFDWLVFPPFAPSAGGFPDSIDETLSDSVWRAKMRMAVELGVERFSLYNYGLLTPATFDSLVAMTRPESQHF